MPATETLLRKLKEILGDEATSDLVTWVDHSTARDIAQLRELADLHYARFDARLEQRLAELKAELRLEQAGLRGEMAHGLAALRVEMATLRADMVKWMFIYWMGTIIPLAGLMVGLVKLAS